MSESRGTRDPKPILGARFLAGMIPVVLLLPLLLGSGPPLSEEAPPGSPPDSTVVRLFITSAKPNCSVKNELGNRETTIPRGTRVLFKNQTDDDVTIIFGHDMRLFGVHEGVVYAHEEQEFRVRHDATVGRHPFRAPCNRDHPGPVIIVPPPPPGEGGH